jgi:3-hydroxybutyrate dehydrogenase
MVGAMIDHFGRLDILINNAGGLMGRGADLQALTHDDALFERNLFLNLTSAYYATRAALPQMVKQDHGRIIFIGSGAAKRGGGSLSYTAAKHGLVGMTRALVYQIPPTITVNTLNPGWTNTSIVDFSRLATNWGVDEAAARARVESVSIQKRILEPEELGPMAVLLASDEGRGITGQEISVDGGFKV